MGKVTTSALAAGGVGTMLIAAAQTRPDEAASNISGWLRLLGVDKVPDFFVNAEADAWTTGIGIAMTVAAFAVLWSLRWSPKVLLKGIAQDTAALLGPRHANLSSSQAVNQRPSPMEQLLAKRELLQAEIGRMERSIAPCREAVEQYRQGLINFSKQRVSRPTFDPLWLERTLPSAASAFTNTRLKDAGWSTRLNRPQPTIEQSTATADSLTGNRQYFEPEHNGRYLGLHRENLVYLDEALGEVNGRLQELQNQLAQVQERIQMEARKISD